MTIFMVIKKALQMKWADKVSMGLCKTIIYLCKLVFWGQNPVADNYLQVLKSITNKKRTKTILQGSTTCATFNDEALHTVF